MSRKIFLRTLGGLSVLFLVLSCAHLGTGPDPKAELRKRVAAGWQAMVDGNCAALYDMTTAAFRQTMSRKEFSTLCNKNIESFEIADIGLVGEPPKEADVTVRYRMTFRSFPFDLEAKQYWVWESGGWFLDPVRTATPMSQ